MFGRNAKLAKLTAWLKIMEILITRIIEALVFPPGGVLLLFVVGLVLLRQRSALARPLLWLSVGIGYVFSTPLFADFLMTQLQSHPALSAKEVKASGGRAIVVLSAGRNEQAAEFGGVDVVGENTFLRLRYAAHLHRMTGLPLLVSGGRPLGEEGPSLAHLMAESLQQDFGIDTVWLEERSRTTGENALFSEEILTQKGIDTILLVTQAWHMPRSVAIFEQLGLKVIPAPTAFVGSGDDFQIFLPSAKYLHATRYALHEMVGMLWYKIRY